MTETLEFNTIHDLLQRLQDLHVRTRETPLFNPVFQLGLDISRALEAGTTDLDTLSSLVEELECESLQARASRLQRNLAPVAIEANEAKLTEVLATTDDFDAFRRRWETPFLHTVFTAHPTFLLTPDQSAAVAKAASSDG